MKFKYNFLAKRLWRIEEDYLYEISEENRYIEHLNYWTKISFKLRDNHWIIFTYREEYHQISVSCGNSICFESKIKREPREPVETIFELTEADRKQNN